MLYGGPLHTTDENSELARMQSLYDKIAKLDEMLRRNIEDLRVETPQVKEDDSR